MSHMVISIIQLACFVAIGILQGIQLWRSWKEYKSSCEEGNDSDCRADCSKDKSRKS